MAEAQEFDRIIDRAPEDDFTAFGLLSAIFLPIASKFRLAGCWHQMHAARMKTPATFTARVLRDGEWFVAFSPEYPEGNGQGITEEEALESPRESILLLLEDRREGARASMGSGEKLIPLALA